MRLYRYYHKKTIWLTGFIAWTLFILSLTVIPDTDQMIQKHSAEFRWDYLEHFLAFFIFGTLYILWRGDSNYSIRGIELFLMFSVAFSFATLTEILQLAIPGRTFNPIDVIYNLAGVLSSILLVYFYLVRHYLRKKHSIINS